MQDFRNSMVRQMELWRIQAEAEIAHEQITRPPLSEYAVGSEKFEKLWESINLANKYQWPSMLETI
jgi:hypothetical protein